MKSFSKMLKRSALLRQCSFTEMGDFIWYVLRQSLCNGNYHNNLTCMKIFDQTMFITSVSSNISWKDKNKLHSNIFIIKCNINPGPINSFMAVLCRFKISKFTIIFLAYFFPLWSSIKCREVTFLNWNKSK